MSGKAQQQSRLKELIQRGREQGYLTYAEVNDHLPEDISDPEQVEDIIRMINDMGINVFETAPDADALLLAEADTDEAAAEEAAAALAAVETDIGRTTDPVRMYMREMHRRTADPRRRDRNRQTHRGRHSRSHERDRPLPWHRRQHPR